MPYKDPEYARARKREWWWANVEENRAKLRERGKKYYLLDPSKQQERSRNYYARIKTKVLEHYGNCCACCGETEPLFLTIDHVNGGRKAEYKGKYADWGGGRLWRWVFVNNFPPNIRILCFNCNCGRERNGGICPHESQKKQPLTAYIGAVEGESHEKEWQGIRGHGSKLPQKVAELLFPNFKDLRYRD